VGGKEKHNWKPNGRRERVRSRERNWEEERDLEEKGEEER